MVIHKQDAL